MLELACASSSSGMATTPCHGRYLSHAIIRRVHVRRGLTSRRTGPTEPAPSFTSHTSMRAHRAATAVATVLLTSSACGRSQPADQAAPPQLPPTAVQLTTASPLPGRRCDGVCRDPEVAEIDDHPAAGGRPDQPDPREIRRPRRPGRAADADRSAPAAGRRVEPGGRPDRAAGERRVGAAAAPAGDRAVRRRRHREGGARAGADGAADRRREPRGAAGAGATAAGAAALLHGLGADRGNRRRRAGPPRHAGEHADGADDDRRQRHPGAQRVGADRARVRR